MWVCCLGKFCFSDLGGAYLGVSAWTFMWAKQTGVSNVMIMGRGERAFKSFLKHVTASLSDHVAGRIYTVGLIIFIPLIY